MNLQRPHLSALHSNVCRCQNWVSVQWVALAKKKKKGNFAPFVLLKCPSPFLLFVPSPSSPPSAVDLAWSLWMEHRTVFSSSLLSVGHRVALPLHVSVITRGQHCSVPELCHCITEALIDHHIPCSI